MKLSLVVAMDRNGLIGKGGGLPWGRIPADMRHFVETTADSPCIMGRNVFEAMPPRYGRYDVVVSKSMAEIDHRRGPNGEWCSTAVARSPVDALVRAATTARALHLGDDVCVLGGPRIYAAFAGLADLAHVTVIDGEFEGDTWFPFRILDSPEWAPLQEPTTLAPGVVYHRLGRVVKP